MNAGKNSRLHVANCVSLCFSFFPALERFYLVRQDIDLDVSKQL